MLVCTESSHSRSSSLTIHSQFCAVQVKGAFPSTFTAPCILHLTRSNSSKFQIHMNLHGEWLLFRMSAQTIYLKDIEMKLK